MGLSKQAIINITLLSVFVFSALLNVYQFYIISTHKPVLVFLDNEASYVISDNKDRAFEKEEANFIVEFSKNYYNFDPSNFDNKLLNAQKMMAPSLWKQESLAIETRKKIGFYTAKSMNCEITNIQKSKADYKLDMNCKIVDKNEILENKLAYTIQLDHVERNEENPSGLRISSLKAAN